MRRRARARARRTGRRLALAAVLGAAGCEPAERRLLRVNDAAIGELDPHKASDYADFILMMNAYNFLVRTAPDGSLVLDDPRELTLLSRAAVHHRPFAAGAPEIVRLKYSMAVPTVRALMARGGDEITRLSMPPEVLRALARSPDVELAHDRGTSSFFIMLHTRRPPTDDVHFRRALAQAFDYDALLRLLRVDEEFAGGVPSRGPVPPRLPGHDPEAPFPERDLEAARRALARSRYAPDEHPVEILGFGSRQHRAGVAPVPAEHGRDRHPGGHRRRPETTPHANTVDVSACSPDPDSILTAMYHSESTGSSSAMSWLQDPAVDARIEAGRAILDPAARERHDRELNRNLVARQPAIFGYRTTTVVARQRFVRAPRLEDASRAVPTTGGNYVFGEYSLGTPP